MKTTLPTRTDLFFAPASVANARISYDRDERVYSVWSPGHATRSTRRFTKALDIAVGLS